MNEYGAYRAGFEGRELPLAFVDRPALERNVELTATRAGSLRVRVASKSVRCRGVLERLLEEPGFEALYSRWGEFCEVREELDPDGLFLNDHLRDVFEG